MINTTYRSLSELKQIHRVAEQTRRKREYDQKKAAKRLARFITTHNQTD